jgi:hypothetical protein
MLSPGFRRVALVLVLALVPGSVLGAPRPARHSTTGDAPRLLSLAVVPREAVLRGSGASQRFLVLGDYSDGLRRDVTSEARLSLASPAIASVDPDGRVSSRSAGRTLFRAEAGGKTVTAAVTVEEPEAREPFSFPQQIGAILTRNGCNNSACHGGVKGRGGLKLSLNALHPRNDYRWIVEGGRYQVLVAEALPPIVPRIDVKAPEKSLLLQKPTMQVAHAGGERFAVGSADYDALLDWIRRGAPYGEPDAGAIRKLEVFPAEAVLVPKGRHRLIVTALLADGRRRDVTAEVAYQAANPEVARVGADGLVEAVRPGETAILVRAVGQTADARVGVVPRPIAPYPEPPKGNLIDAHVFAKLRTFQILPSAPSTDEEFLRRVCLDLTGTLPPPERLREFVASRDPGKRDKVIEILLASPEYVDFWTLRLADLFRVRGRVTARNLYWQWLHDSIADNKPYDQIARERISAQGLASPATHYLASDGKPPAVERLVSEELRVFTGRRVDCSQCHDHPFDTWSQDQFWGIAAFFRRMTNTAWAEDQILFDDPNGQEIDLGDMGTSALAFKQIRHPRTGKAVEARFFDGEALAAGEEKDARLALARMVTGHPYFAEAAANRVWGYFFGRGIVDPVDDFRWSNPPTHPALLEALARDFREHGHDLKHLMRTIVRSRTYQLSSVPNETNQEDRINYSHAVPRPLETEVLLDAVSRVTGVPEIFKTDDGAMPKGTRAIQLHYPAGYESRFLEVFERPGRDVLPERSGKPTMARALHTLVGATFTEKLAQPGGRLDRLMKRGATDREIVEDLYLAALGRFPTTEEQAELQKALSARPARRPALEHLLWAVISSEEFSFNH